jgi:alpha-tubulin suppressor-like RCC1 family protein
VFGSKNLSAALSKEGVVYTWGFPGSYFLGMGALGRPSSKKNNPYHFPKRISTNAKFLQLALGAQHMVGLASDGQLWQWGKLGGPAGT